MKINGLQETKLNAAASLVKGKNYPWGETCPDCKRPHVFEYSDGTKVCDKCDELVCHGTILKTANK